jgi:RNA polymerase sigma-70 factor (ECF subfamily)
MAPINAHEMLAPLLARIASGDEAAFRELYAVSSPKLFAIARRILGSASLAEDVLQEAYIRIWTSASRFDPALSQPMTWMITIVRNQAIDVRRRTAQRVADRAVELSDVLPDGGAQTSESDRGLDALRLRDCLEALNEQPRAMVLLAYSAGASRQELATHFGRPLSTVKSILRRGLASLKDCLDGEA